MASKCKSCTNNILNADFITCAGLCGEHFHIKCVAVTKPMLAAVSNCPNIHWYCQYCNDGNRNISSVVNGINESIEHLSDSMSSSLLQFLNGIQSLMDKLLPTTGAVNDQSKNETTEVHKLHRHDNGCEERNVFDGSGNNKAREIDSGSDAERRDGSNMATNGSTADDNPVKSVVISNIGKGISIDYLVNYLSGELKIDKRKIHVSLLLPRGKTVDDMFFLQYKVTVPVIKYCSIMNPDTWPNDVRIRDFVNKPRLNFGVPLHHFMEKRTVQC